MNMNTLILANVTNSPYFKTDLFNMKTYHEVVDEIYYKVDHLEPWERGTRKTAGMSQTGMCGGVRGVSAGGVVSSAFCLLFKLHTLRLTKKQAYTLLNHRDSPYIRALGFMYLRFTLPPGEMWKWFQPYMEDEEEIDIKAGGGKCMSMGEFCRLIMTRLEWFETRFPRIAVKEEKLIRAGLEERMNNLRAKQIGMTGGGGQDEQRVEQRVEEPKRRGGGCSRSRSKKRSRSRSKPKKRSRSRERKRSKSRDRSRQKKDKKHKRSRSRSKKSKKRRSKDRSRSVSRGGRTGDSYEDELRKYKQLKKSKRSRSRSR